MCKKNVALEDEEGNKVNFRFHNNNLILSNESKVWEDFRFENLMWRVSIDGCAPTSERRKFNKNGFLWKFLCLTSPHGFGLRPYLNGFDSSSYSNVQSKIRDQLFRCAELIKSHG